MDTKRSMARLAVLALLAAGLAVARPSASGADASGGGGNYVPLAVTRIMETRTGTGGVPKAMIGENRDVAFPVLGRGGVPAVGVSAVLVDVAIVAPTANTWFSVWGNGSPRPNTSVVSGPARRVISNNAIVPVGADGRLRLYNRWGSTDAAVDVHGYFTSLPTNQGGGFVPVPNITIADTRSGLGVPAGALPGTNGRATVRVTGGAVPADAIAVYLDVVAVGAGDAGWMSAHPDGSTPTGSTIDYLPGDTASGAMVRVGAGGRIVFTNHSSRPTHLLVHLQGYVTASPAAGAGYRPLNDNLADTRATQTPIGPGEVRDIAVAGAFRTPTRGMSAVLNVAVVPGNGAGHLRIWPTGSTEPTTSAANFTANLTREDTVIVRPRLAGKVRIRNLGRVAVDLTVDLQGWFADPLTPVPATDYTPLSVIQERDLPGAPAERPLWWSWTRSDGTVMLGYQPRPDVFNDLQAAPIGDGFWYTGTPALGQRSDRRVEAVAQSLDSNLRAFTTTEPQRATGTWEPQGGSMASAPTIGTLPTVLVRFGVDADGRLWDLRQDQTSGTYTSWRPLSEAAVPAPRLAAAPTVVAATPGLLRLFARGVDGSVHTTLYEPNTGVLGWTDLGGDGVTGVPAALTGNGFRSRVFVRAADGSIRTKAEDASGAFAAAWTPVGNLTGAGSPTVAREPTTGRIVVAVRDGGGLIWGSIETAAGSGAWGTPFGGQNFEAALTDPTAIAITNGATSRLWVTFLKRGHVPEFVEFEWRTAATGGTAPALTAGRTPPADRG